MANIHQLVAILFTDIVDYTSLMQHDENKAVQILHQFRETLNTIVPEFDGKIVNYYGDGCLAIFTNAANAASCAKALQQEFLYKTEVPARLGLHMGDVMAEEGNVFGDSVNIAARIQSMGVSGAVLFSDTIKDQIKNKPEFQFHSLGHFEFKNIDEPLEVFALSNKGFPIPNASELKGKFKDSPKTKQWFNNTLKLTSAVLIMAALGVTGYFGNKKFMPRDPDKSIAVLAFTDMSPDKSQEYLGDGLADDIITALSKIGELKVIGRTSSFQFKGKNTDLREIGKKLDVAAVLEGSVQKSGSKIRVTAQLIETKDGTHIWSHKWDREMTDIFSIQDEIATGISEKLKVTFLKKPGKMHMNVKPEAYELFLMGKQIIDSGGPLNKIKAKEYFLKSKSIDSTFSTNIAYLSRIYRQLVEVFPPANENQARLMKDSVIYYARLALSLNPEDPEAYIVLANWHSDNYNWIETDKMIRKAHELNPGATEKNRLASFLYVMGDEKQGSFYLKEALLLDPLSKSIKNSFVHHMMFTRQFDEAISTAKKYLETDSTNVNYWGSLANSYIGKKQYKEALNCWTHQHESYGNKELADIYRKYDFKTAMNAWLEMAESKKVVHATIVAKANVYAMLKDKENTLKYLELALANKQNLQLIKKYWLYDFIRNEPRFKELYRKLNFDAYDEYRKKMK